MKRQLFTAASALALTATALACGSLEAKTDSAPVLATIRGQLTNDSQIPIDGAVRVAVVWRAITEGQYNVAQDLPVQPQFPSQFAITLDGPPPAEAMQDGSALAGTTSQGTGAGGGSSGSSSGGPSSSSSSSSSSGAPSTQSVPATTGGDWQVAIGSVVAYVDENGNGKLDLVADGASGYVDRIAATNDGLAVIYLQGDFPSSIADGSSGTPTLGYQLYKVCDATYVPPRSTGSLCTADAGAPPACTPGFLSIDTPITLAVASDPHVNALMCQKSDQVESGGGSSSGPGEPQPAQYPDVCDPNLYCAPDGSLYVYSVCTTVEKGICEGTDTECASKQIVRPSPAPDGWPCKKQ